MVMEHPLPNHIYDVVARVPDLLPVLHPKRPFGSAHFEEQQQLQEVFAFAPEQNLLKFLQECWSTELQLRYHIDVPVVHEEDSFPA